MAALAQPATRWLSPPGSIISGSATTTTRQRTPVGALEHTRGFRSLRPNHCPAAAPRILPSRRPRAAVSSHIYFELCEGKGRRAGVRWCRKRFLSCGRRGHTTRNRNQELSMRKCDASRIRDDGRGRHPIHQPDWRAGTATPTFSRRAERLTWRGGPGAP